MEHRADEQQVRAIDSLDPLCRESGRLEQVPVHRETMVGIALRTVSHRAPLGDDPRQDPHLVQGLERPRTSMPGAKGGKERILRR
jgi:hypothetical protein